MAPEVLEGSPNLPGSVRAIARYLLPETVRLCNLDEPRQLLKLKLRPSQVVSRDYTVTRDWARRIHEQRQWAGVRWWSYYDSRWSSHGLWDLRSLVLDEIRVLRLDDPSLLEASKIIARRVHTDRQRS